MGDYAWTWSGCRPDAQWYGIPGSGSYLNTARFGTYWVGGGIYQKYAQNGYECGALGVPVKEYQWLSEFGAWGQWFEFGAIYYSGAWRVAYGNWGQTAGRLVEAPEPVIPDDAERPPEDEVPVPPGNIPEISPSRHPAAGT